jgi:hypothetical protein
MDHHAAPGGLCHGSFVDQFQMLLARLNKLPVGTKVADKSLCFVFLFESQTREGVMFAGSVQSNVCHLIEGDRKTTICGLRVSTFVSPRRSGGRIHLLTSQPSDCRICKHCQRLGAATSAWDKSQQYEGSFPG